MPLTHLNPETMHRNPAFSQGVLIEPPGALVVVGEQNGVDEHGMVVGDDLGTQTRQALRNVLKVLESVGASQQDVVKLTIYLVAPADIAAGYGAAVEVWGMHPAALTAIQVVALGRPEWLVGIEALAQVPSR